jgi:pimeloyl-ACP methyl ester carboxylesterase
VTLVGHSFGARATVEGVMLASGRAVASLLASARLRVLENTGHIPAIESPAEFNAALLEFLASVTDEPRTRAR